MIRLEKEEKKIYTEALLVAEKEQQQQQHNNKENASKKGLDYQTLDDLQDAWATTCDPTQLVEMGKSMSELWNTGFFAKLPGMGKGSFKFKAEKEYMEERQLRYEVEDRNTSLLGCIAKQCSRSKSDQVRTINIRGKRVHGNIITNMSRRGATNLTTKYENTNAMVRSTVKASKVTMEMDSPTVAAAKEKEVKVSRTRKTLRLLHAERAGGRKKGRMGNLVVEPTSLPISQSLPISHGVAALSTSTSRQVSLPISDRARLPTSVSLSTSVSSTHRSAKRPSMNSAKSQAPMKNLAKSKDIKRLLEKKMGDVSWDVLLFCLFLFFFN